MVFSGKGPSLTIFLIALVLLGGAGRESWAALAPKPGDAAQGRNAMETGGNLAVATLAGGCFWCVEADFEKVPGVVRVVSGYTGGSGANPTYEDYADSGHVEAVQVFYDPRKVSYQALLDYFWRHIDPTDAGGQFVDRGPQYRSAIFYHDDEQKAVAEASKTALAGSGHFRKPIVTEIIKFSKFYPAEDYHQHYSQKNPVRYKYYRWNSGRDQFLEEHWGKP
jgi:peptide methionine sulfoxide reductase msrA/msrB